MGSKSLTCCFYWCLLVFSGCREGLAKGRILRCVVLGSRVGLGGAELSGWWVEVQPGGLLACADCRKVIFLLCRSICTFMYM